MPLSPEDDLLYASQVIGSDSGYRSEATFPLCDSEFLGDTE